MALREPWTARKSSYLLKKPVCTSLEEDLQTNLIPWTFLLSRKPPHAWSHEPFWDLTSRTCTHSPVSCSVSSAARGSSSSLALSHTLVLESVCRISRSPSATPAFLFSPLGCPFKAASGHQASSPLCQSPLSGVSVLRAAIVTIHASFRSFQSLGETSCLIFTVSCRTQEKKSFVM